MNQVKYLGIFKEPEQAAPDAPVPGDEAAQKVVAEQAVEVPPAVVAPDTSGTQISPPQVGKSTARPEGDSDVVV